MADAFIYMGEPNPVVPRGATRVIVDESVNIIPAFAFHGNGSIVELICRDGVVRVRKWAFNHCRSLRRVIMPGVEAVERAAFDDCEALVDVECGKLERIEQEAFSDCKSLTSIDLPSVDFVGEYAFARCEALTDAIFGDKLKSIRRRAFFNCTSLEQITIPLKDGMIGDDNIFNGCKKLERVDLVGGVYETVAALLMEEWKNDCTPRNHGNLPPPPHTYVHMLLQHDGYITWAILHGSVLFGTKANDTVPADARLIDGYPVDSLFYVSGT
eukprot:scaffold15644_cov95-Skeletonema_dohrnii-CCMP3373.AAC.3